VKRVHAYAPAAPDAAGSGAELGNAHVIIWVTQIFLLCGGPLVHTLGTTQFMPTRQTSLEGAQQQMSLFTTRSSSGSDGDGRWLRASTWPHDPIDPTAAAGRHWCLLRVPGAYGSNGLGATLVATHTKTVLTYKGV
jgi:hypothetical protein